MESITISTREYNKLKRVYDKYEIKKEQSRLLMKKKYDTRKLEKLQNKQNMTPEEMEWILDHTN